MANGPSNQEIADFLGDFCVLMELNGADSFRVRALSSSVRILEGLQEEAASLVAEGNLTEVKGVGKRLAELIAEYVETGTASRYEELKNTIPPGLLEMLRVQGLGAKKVRAIHQELGVDDLEGLATACRRGELTNLSGFAAKTQDKILKGIEHVLRFNDRFRVDEAVTVAEDLRRHLYQHPDCIRLGVAGSLRRCKETVKDVDLVLSSNNPTAVANAFVAHERVTKIVVRGDTKTTVQLDNGMQADLRIVADRDFPTLLHHMTGSKEHNVDLRGLALSRGLKLSEYGLFREEERLECADEAALFAHLGLDFIPPEMREGLGEVEAAAAGELPSLISQDQVRGMLHLHSTYSDGSDSLETMARAIADLGYEYMGISDHSKSAAYAGGLKEDAISRQHDEIDRLNDRFENLHIFRGIESDILADGSLDYNDEVLARFDYIVASVHSVFGMSEANMTSRIVRAIQHPCTTIVGHLTGRLLLDREGYSVDANSILAAAAEHRVAVEINANPRRLELDWRHLRQARDQGVRIAVNTDAHRVDGLHHLGWGIGIARKGWLRAEDVINTYNVEAVARFFAKTS